MFSAIETLLGRIGLNRPIHRVIAWLRMRKSSGGLVERTLIIIKPDAMQRGLAGEIIRRFETRGLRIVGLKFMQISRELAEQHYAEHVGKDFYESLLAYITSAPVIVLVLEGKAAIEAARNTIGKTDPVEAAAGTIRGDLGMEKGRNLVHGSDKRESAQREVSLFFSPAELVNWQRDTDRWIYEE
jgi:nucleoside-diphosphate kinase